MISLKESDAFPAGYALGEKVRKLILRELGNLNPVLLSPE